MNYNVTISSKKPVTIFYQGTGVVPNRQVVYRVVKKVKTIGERQYGYITHEYKRVKVYRDNVPGAQWEAVTMILPSYLRMQKLS